MTSGQFQIVDLLGAAHNQIDAVDAVAAEARFVDADRPWVYTNMIQSADGATAVDGLSGPLGGPPDLAMLLALRAVADVIIVGATTVAGEGYAPPNPPDATIAARRERGQEDRPIVAVVSGSLSITPDAPLFSDPTYRPIVFTGTAAPASRRIALEAVADVVSAVDQDTNRVAMAKALDHLNSLGYKNILLEGGPKLNGQFVADDLIDEWNITISPLLAGGPAARAAEGPITSARPMRLERLWEADGLLFARYLRD